MSEYCCFQAFIGKNTNVDVRFDFGSSLFGTRTFQKVDPFLLCVSVCSDMRWE